MIGGLHLSVHFLGDYVQEIYLYRRGRCLGGVLLHPHILRHLNLHLRKSEL